MSLTENAANEDWELLKSFFPPNWASLAQESGALKGLRQDKSEGKFLRTLLMHVGCGYSLRETVARAKLAELADLSDVALLKRLRKSKDWLYQLCCGLFSEREIVAPAQGLPRVCLVDGTTVSEPGKTGSIWRVHYALQWPSLEYRFMKITPCQGKGSGEGLVHYPFVKDEHVIADRGYCHASGIHYANQCGARVMVRLNPDGIRLLDTKGEVLDIEQELDGQSRPGTINTFNALIPFKKENPFPARICTIKKSQQAIAEAHKKLKRKASKNGMQLQPRTLRYAEYVMIITTFDEATYPANVALEWYRLRWQIELVFKRFKQIAKLGHLPKKDEESSVAWLYGKLFVALLTEKLIAHARDFSPWGFNLENNQREKSLA